MQASGPHGAFFAETGAVVEPASTEAGDERLEMLPADVAVELRACVDDTSNAERQDHAFLLVPRRMREGMNSLGRNVAGLATTTYNPAYMHPDDLAAIGLSRGAVVRLSSSHGSIPAIAENLRRGVVSMTHCWGRLPDDFRPVARVGPTRRC